MKKGDRVLVQVGRNKQRGGVLQAADHECAVVRYDQSERDVVVPITDVSTHKTATKHDQEKTRMELIPASGLEALGRAMTYGSKKYDDHNWANGFEWDRLVGSLMRHLNAWRAGEDFDPESGLSHIDHVLANAAMLAAHIDEGLGSDNRRKVKG